MFKTVTEFKDWLYALNTGNFTEFITVFDYYKVELDKIVQAVNDFIQHNQIEGALTQLKHLHDLKYENQTLTPNHRKKIEAQYDQLNLRLRAI